MLKLDPSHVFTEDPGSSYSHKHQTWIMESTSWMIVLTGFSTNMRRYGWIAAQIVVRHLHEQGLLEVQVGPHINVSICIHQQLGSSCQAGQIHFPWHPDPKHPGLDRLENTQMIRKSLEKNKSSLESKRCLSYDELV